MSNWQKWCWDFLLSFFEGSNKNWNVQILGVGLKIQYIEELRIQDFAH